MIFLATDTGVRKTILNKDVWDKIKADCTLVKTSKGFRPYGLSSYRLPIIGRACIMLTAEHGASIKTWVYIVNSRSESSLLGEKDAVRLGIVKIDLKGARKEVGVAEEVKKIDYIQKEKPAIGGVVSGNQTQAEIDANMIQIRNRFQKNFSNSTGKAKGPPITFQFNKLAKPVVQRRRRIPMQYIDRLKNELNEMVRDDVIEGPLEHEEKGSFISNLVIADRKNSDRIRVTLDCKEVNKHIYSTNEPIPTVEELRHKFKGADRFSKLDLTNCYHQFEIEERARKLFTFQTPWGIYRYKRMVMGTSPASSEVQRRMRQIIQGCQNVVHIKDDIIVYGKGEEHDRCLVEVLKVLEDCTLRPEKCSLGQPEISWFGYIFTKHGMSPDPEKCRIIKEWKAPKSKEEVKSFLQTVQFNAKFMSGKHGEKSYPELTQPLRALIKKNARFKWDIAERQAFKDLKERLCENSVIVPYDTKRNTRMYVDASPVGMQTTIAQKYIVDDSDVWRPVNHMSRPWTPEESRYGQIERESNGIQSGMHMNRMYTTGTHVEIVTDHKPLVQIYDVANPSKDYQPRVERHRNKIAPFDYHVIYEPGSQGPCDYGSRHPPVMTEFTSQQIDDWSIESDDEIIVNRIVEDLIPSAIPIAVLREETSNDKNLKMVREDLQLKLKCRPELKSYKGIFDELSYVNGLILRGRKIVIPLSLQSEVIGLAHECHMGVEKTVNLIRETMWFPRLHELVKEYVKTCRGCLASNNTTTPVPLEPNFLPDRPWQKLHADFKGPIGDQYYLHILIDQYSKFPEVEVVSSTKFEKLRPILDRVFATHGIPEEISSDQGPPYQSHEMQLYAKEMGFKMRPTTPRDPQSNGFAENFVKVLCKLIHACIAEGKNPKVELNKFLLQYRAAPQLTSGVSPAEGLYNRKIRTKLPQYHSQQDTEIQKEMRLRHDNRKCKQKKNFYRRKNAKDKVVNVGDQVLIRQEKSTTKTPFSSDPLTVTNVQGNQITATNGRIIRKRDKNHLKVLPLRPDHLKPSWERSQHTVFGFKDDLMPLDDVQHVRDQAQDLALAQSTTMPFTLDADMAARMAQLVNNAEVTAQRHSDTPLAAEEPEGRITRSKGVSLSWNKEMNSKSPVLEVRDGE